MSSPASMHPKRETAFTLVETLVVIAIISITMAMLVPNINQQMGSQYIDQAAHMVSQNISLAQQTAMITGQSAEVRFVQVENDSVLQWRAVQVWGHKNSSTTLEPLNAPSMLPSTVTIAESQSLSPLISTVLTGTAKMPATGGAKISGKSYKALSIRPSGLLEPAPADAAAKRLYFLTIAEIRQLARTDSPANFATIAIQPDTGRPIIYRP